MSYILDALKKSEEKRGAESAALARPAAVPLGQSGQRRFVWPLMLAVAALIAGWLVAQWQALDPESVLGQSIVSLPDEVKIDSSRLVAAPSVGARLIASRFIASEPVVHPAAEPALNQLQTSRSVPLIKENSIPAQENKPVFKLVNASSPVSRMNGSQRFAVDQQSEPVNIRSRFDLPETEQQSLPELSIEGHIYDAEPQTRMVIINSKVRKEKQSISAGLVLQEITVDGVILNYHGYVFHMGVFER